MLITSNVKAKSPSPSNVKHWELVLLYCLSLKYSFNFQNYHKKQLKTMQSLAASNDVDNRSATFSVISKIIVFDIHGFPNWRWWFLGCSKHIQESVGVQFKTWWGQHQDFLKWPKKLHPYYNIITKLYNEKLSNFGLVEKEMKLVFIEDFIKLRQLKITMFIPLCFWPLVLLVLMIETGPYQVERLS